MRVLLSIVSLALVGAAGLQESRARAIALCVMALVSSGTAIAGYFVGEWLRLRRRGAPSFRRSASRLATRE